MRVSDKLLFNTVTNNLNNNLEAILKLQEHAATGKKINRPSDDPAGIMKVINYNAAISRAEQYERNIDNGMVFLDTTETSISSAQNIVTRIKEISISALNDTVSSEERTKMAKEVEQLYKQVLQIANTQVNGRYIFSGFNGNTLAYSSDGTYNGTTSPDGYIKIEIDPGSTIAINLPGYKVFGTSSYGTDIMGTLNNVKTALENNDTTTLSSLMSDIDLSMDQLSNARAEVGAKINRLETAKDYWGKIKLDLNTYRSDIEEVDITKVITDLSIQYNVLEMTRYSASQILSQSLLDFLG